jgi:hypothetical protein
MTDLDELMSKDPLELSKQDIDEIIAYQRKNRALREAGVKVKKGTADGPPKPKLTLASLGIKLKADEKFTRRA